MISEWFSVSGNSSVMIVASAACIYLAILIYTRVVGLRSFSKMSAPDFAMTVAVGSLFASSISGPTPTVGASLVALFALYGGQWAMACARRKSGWFFQWFENQPILLMKDGEMLEQNLKIANVKHADVMAKLREANVLNLEQVRAVVFETTGDISVLHSKDKTQIQDILISGVRI